MEDYIQVFTTAEKKEDAERIARALLESRLAACVQIIGPVESRFWWKDNLDKAQEWMCVIKSRKGLYEKLEECIKATHPYEVPEIIATPVIAGSKSYLEWMDKELGN